MTDIQEQKRLVKDGMGYLNRNDVKGFLTFVKYKGNASLEDIGIGDIFTMLLDKGFDVYKYTDYKILTGMFSGASMTNFSIQDGVTEIGNEAFRGCENLSSIEIPDSVTRIGRGAFHGCASLETIKLPISVRKIGANAFEGCEHSLVIYTPKRTGTTRLEVPEYELEWYKQHLVTLGDNVR